MRNIQLAETILSAVLDRGRAASIVGDLLEDAASQGSLWFWSGVVKILISRIWRPIAGFAASFYVLLYGQLAFALASTPAHPDGGIAVAFGDLALLTLMAAAFCLFCYGPRDPLTQLTFSLGADGMLATCFRWLPGVPATAAVAAALILLLFALSAQRLRSLFAFIAILAVSAAVDSAILICLDRLCPQRHYWVVVWATVILFLMVLTETIAISQARRLLLTPRSLLA